MATNANNYHIETSFTISGDVIQDATPDITFDWSNLTRDMWGRPVDPTTDIDLVMISLWRSSSQALFGQLDAGTLDLSQNLGAMWVLPEGEPHAKLTDFGPMGEPASWDNILPYFDSNSPTYAPSAFTHIDHGPNRYSHGRA